MKNERNYDKIEKELEFIPCNLCDIEDFKPLFESHDYLLFSPLSFKLVQCNRCGLIFLNPRPKDMDKYYSGYYEKIFAKGFFEWLSPDRVKKITKLKKGGRILDIGCGKGDFLYAMSKEGWEVYGNEISEHNCDHIRNKLYLKNIYSGPFHSVELPENYFDIITLFNVLEHLKEPRQTLEKINRLLKDDGILVIESPDFDSLQSAIFRDAWYGLDLPRHLYQLSPSTVDKFLQATGFRIVKKDYFVHALYAFISLRASMLRWAGIQGRPPAASPQELPAKRTLKRGVLQTTGGFACDIFCLLASFFCSLINCKDIFRVYCAKTKESANPAKQL